MTLAASLRDRLAAAVADRYRLERELGQGGMATVYLAEDLKHKRRVALKVLKPELAAVLGAERFVQEITTTAALQHPHILPLFDSGTADGFLYYVMPFIDGETLRAKLDRETQLGIDESVRITRDVADALEYAHRHGVIHRDIKPENILLANGRPMVADFGIALAVSAAAGGRMTETGLSLGTPHYMSPEQATAEKEITARSDVYSLGSVLYEMLTGNPPHTGASAQQIIMKIVTEEPAPVTKHRKSVPPNVAAAVAKSLEKLAADRFESAREFADALANPAYTDLNAPSAMATAADQRWRRRFYVAAAVAALLIVAALVAPRRWVGGGSSNATVPRVHLRLVLDSGIRVALGLGDSSTNAMRPSRTSFALSPDGSTLVFAGQRDSLIQLYVRPLAADRSTPVPGTEGAESPFFSPDGRSIAFYAAGKVRRVRLAGGPPEDVATVSRIIGGVWTDDDRIAIGTLGAGILVMAANGGGKVDTLVGQGAAHPQILSGGRVLLFGMRRGALGNALPATAIEALDLRSGKRQVVVEDAADPRWLRGGRVIFARQGKLMAVSFDADRMRATGAPQLIVEDVMQAFNSTNTSTRTGAAQMAVSSSGTLAFLTGGITPDRSGDVRWVNRQGTATPISALDSAQYHSMRVSPDGRHVAITTFGLKPSLQVFDTERRISQPLAIVGPPDWPLWSPDGRRVVYSGSVGDSTIVLSSPADGSRPPERLSKDAVNAYPAFWSSDGKELFLVSTGISTGSNRALIGITVADGRRREVANLAPGFSWPTLSPDGKWLAYSRPNGEVFDVYVQPWPALDRRWKVSTGNGTMPMWSKGGRELLFVQAQAQSGPLRLSTMFAVSVSGGAEPGFSAPQALFTDEIRGMNVIRNIDVTPDGSRFMIVTRRMHSSPPGDLHVRLNWLPP